jgi:hypothetical protein
MSAHTPAETVCYVKPQEKAKAIPRLRALFVRLFTGESPVIETMRPSKGSPFVMVETQPNGCYPNRLLICHPAESVTTPYNVGKRKTVFLRNIRCRGEEHEVLHNLLCMACGAVQVLTPAELDQLRPERCPQCKAGVSLTACPISHSFGFCAECSDVDLDGCPFDPAEVDP